VPSLDAAAATATASAAAAVDVEALMAQLFCERAQAARFDRALSATLVAQSPPARLWGGARSGAFASKEDEGV
jgi:hypothetical protein